jgi:TolB-like protein
MRKTFIFRSLCMVMVWVHCAVAVQAGQVITDKERAWAKNSATMAEIEKSIAPVSASNTIAVLYFKNKTGLQDLNALQKGMAIMLITDLAKVQKLQVVERIKIQALLDEMNLGASGLVDQGSAPKVGKLLGAYYISTGDITLGKMAQLNISPVLVDVPFETVTPQSATLGNLQDLFRMEKEILFNIVKQMKIFLTPKEREELKKPLAASSTAALAFFAGVDLSDKGRYAEAINMYEKAIAEDKNFSMAKDALQELKTLGLTTQTEVPTTPAATEAVEEGTSKGTIALATLGVLAVGGGVALALSGSSSSSSTPQTNTKGPVITSTDPAEGSVLGTNCSSGTIVYTFDKPIANCSNVVFSTGWEFASQLIRGSDLRASYTGQTSVCDTYSASGIVLTTTVSGCQDASGITMTTTQKTFKNK